MIYLMGFMPVSTQLLTSIIRKKTKNIRFAHRLSKKAINLKVWSKQNVQLALYIFDPTTSVGLLQIIDDFLTDIAYSTVQNAFKKFGKF